MPIHAQLTPPEPTGTKVRSPRRRVRLGLPGTSPSGGTSDVLVHNISVTGLLLETSEDLAIGEDIFIDLPRAGSNSARVVWSSGNLYGCQFKKNISAATLSAAQLLSPTETTAPPPIDSGKEELETFGTRLRRLRERKGLSVRELARLMKVSVPTVYNWQSGKARPRSATIRNLAQVLEVPSLELRDSKPHEVALQETCVSSDSSPRDSLGTMSFAGSRFGEPVRHEARLFQLIATSKEQIAAIAGTTADKVKIILEL